MTIRMFDLMLLIIFVVLVWLWLNSLGPFAGELSEAGRWFKSIGVSASIAWPG